MRFLITAGPTREPIDPVRFISNGSSGKMGYAIATAAAAAGHGVTLISGPVCLAAPADVEMERVVTADEMCVRVLACLGAADVLVMCAAVADFKPRTRYTSKIKKAAGFSAIEVEPTPDILCLIADLERRPLTVGFAAETEAFENNARQKLLAKNCDLMIANDARQAIDSDENELILLFRNGEVRALPRAPKTALADELVKIFSHLAEKR